MDIKFGPFPIEGYSRYEISDGGLIRNKETRTLIGSEPDGTYRLYNDVEERTYIPNPVGVAKTKKVTAKVAPVVIPAPVVEKPKEMPKPPVIEAPVEKPVEAPAVMETSTTATVPEVKTPEPVDNPPVEKPKIIKPVVKKEATKKEDAPAPGTIDLKYKKGDKIWFVATDTKKETKATVKAARMHTGRVLVELYPEGSDKVVYRYLDKVRPA